MSNRKPLSGTIVVVVSDLMDKTWIPPSNFLSRTWINNKLKTKRKRNLVVLTYTFLVDPTAQSWFVTMSFHTSGSWCIVILNVQFQKPTNRFRAHGHHSIECSHIFTMTESFVDDINLLDNYCSEVVQNLFQDLQELLSTSQRALSKKDDLLIVPDNARVFAEAVPKAAKSSPSAAKSGPWS